jgi:hypothetical protein
MKCNSYATLGVYRNILMPVKKSDFRRKKKVTENFEAEEQPMINLDNLDNLEINTTGCSEDERNYCDRYNKPCVLSSNNEAICQIGETNTYQDILKFGMKARKQ